VLPIAILAGGFATRLGEASKVKPKSLVEVNGRPFADWQMSLLKSAGYRDFVFCLSHLGEQIQTHFGDGSSFGVNIQYSFDGHKQLGTAGAIKNAIHLLGPRFAVIYGDSYLPIDYASVEEAFKVLSGSSLMTIYKNFEELDTNNVILNQNGLITYNKFFPNTQMQYIDYGLSYFQASAFDKVGHGASYDLADLCAEISENHQLVGYEVHNRFYEVGSQAGIVELTKKLRDGSA
jgi:NDP-sugar pyrophosphorylase family protein